MIERRSKVANHGRDILSVVFSITIPMHSACKLVGGCIDDNGNTSLLLKQLSTSDQEIAASPGYLAVTVYIERSMTTRKENNHSDR